MEYKETSDENIVPASDFLDDENELDFDEESAANVTALPEEHVPAEIIDPRKAKAQAAKERFSLKARRAIEDHLEQRRLRKELDYLFDDDFVGENGEETPIKTP